jgi:hypothetical protein
LPENINPTPTLQGKNQQQVKKDKMFGRSNSACNVATVFTHSCNIIQKIIFEKQISIVTHCSQWYGSLQSEM